MATETLRPNGIGTETNLVLQAPNTGEANWEDVDEATADDMTTCVKTATDDTVYQRDLYALPSHSVGSGVINKVTIYWRWRTTADASKTSYTKPVIRTHSVTYDGTEISYSEYSAWHTESQEYNTNPNTSSAWTWDEVDALEIGASLKTSVDTYHALLTQVYVVIDYTALTEKTSSETGSGSDSLGARFLGVVEEGQGAEALFARLLAGIESACGLEAGGLFFSSNDTGSGLDAVLSQGVQLVLNDAGSGVDLSSLLKALLSVDSGLGADAITTLLANIVTGELVVGIDCFVAKVESAPKGVGMKLPPGGKTSIPSRRVNI